MNLSRLVSRRISTRSLGGPIEIASQAFNVAGEDLATFALFLAMISINLAVVNFLPIPLLDGGHMVFLVYEKLRGRPPSEMVRVVVHLHRPGVHPVAHGLRVLQRHQPLVVRKVSGAPGQFGRRS